jgi:hypothetical protein
MRESGKENKWRLKIKNSKIIRLYIDSKLMEMKQNIV